MKTKKKPASSLDRAIRSRERGILRMEDNRRKVLERAAADVAAIDRRIKEKSVLLEALKRGAIAK